MKTNLFEVAGTPEWEADNLRRMMKIRGSEENIKEWSDFWVEQLKMSLLEEDDGKKEIIRKTVQIALQMIEENIYYIVEIYSLRKPMYRKYKMETLEFETYIKEYFYSYISDELGKVDFEQVNQTVDLENVIKRFQENLRKIAIFAGHAKGEVRFPTESEEFVNLNEKEFQLTIQILDENIDSLIRIYELLKKLYPEGCTAELSDFEHKVSKFLYAGIYTNIKTGIEDIEKKQRMFRMFESGHNG